MTDTQHTGTPWEYDNSLKYYSEVIRRNGQVVAIMPSSLTLSGETRDANARFIIKACNNYDKLVEALKTFVDSFEANRVVSLSIRIKAYELAKQVLSQLKEGDK